MEGSCQCQKVKFSISSDCPGPIQRCYCSVCQKISGAPFAVFYQCLKESLHIKAGKEFLKTYQALTAKRTFCQNCGSNLFFEDPRWDKYIFPTATSIDTKIQTPPKWVHIFSEDAPSWFQIKEEGPRFNGYSNKTSSEWFQEFQGDQSNE